MLTELCGRVLGFLSFGSFASAWCELGIMTPAKHRLRSTITSEVMVFEVCLTRGFWSCNVPEPC